MRIFISTLACFLFISTALADQPTAIMLPPIEGQKALWLETTNNITGSCGTSIVRVLGVKKVISNFYTIDLDAGRIIIRSAGEELVLDANDGTLSDHNGIACVPTESGSRLLVWSNCSGSVCGDDFSFVIVDPERLVILAPKDPYKETCHAKCASKLLGNELPQKINSD